MLRFSLSSLVATDGAEASASAMADGSSGSVAPPTISTSSPREKTERTVCICPASLGSLRRKSTVVVRAADPGAAAGRRSANAPVRQVLT